MTTRIERQSSLTMKIRGRTFRPVDFVEASAMFCAASQALSRKSGGILRGVDICGDGVIVARVSQNGRVWSPEPWTPESKPIVEAQWPEAAHGPLNCLAGSPAPTPVGAALAASRLPRAIVPAME